MISLQIGEAALTVALLLALAELLAIGTAPALIRRAIPGDGHVLGITQQSKI
jgi:hypothetical protein